MYTIRVFGTDKYVMLIEMVSFQGVPVEGFNVHSASSTTSQISQHPHTVYIYTSPWQSRAKMQSVDILTDHTFDHTPFN